MITYRQVFSIVAALLMLYYFNRSYERIGSLPKLGIPHTIWQIYFPYSPIDDLKPLISTWPIVNPGFHYICLGSREAEDMVTAKYGHRPEVLDTFLALNNQVLRADLLRYMLLETEGGIYSDLDTEALKAFDQWIPQSLKSSVGFIVGIEYDQGQDEPYFGMSLPLQLCQWTLASARGHLIARKAVNRAVAELRAMATATQTTIATLKFTDRDVMNLTGPVMFTHAVLDSLYELTGSPVTYRDLSGLTEPKLIGDVLILPIDGFGSGQPHSHSTRKDGIYPPAAVVRHHWKGSWKAGM